MIEKEQVTVEDNVIIVNTDEHKGNLVFYQGGLVESTAYLPLALSLSREGFRVFIPNMPLNLAILNTAAFEDIQSTYPSDEPWLLGGHSLGGASASIFVSGNSEAVDGLFFLAAYPSSGSDLSKYALPVLSVTATNDNILNWESYEEAQLNLPEESLTSVIIEGGNHSNFGYYGFQSGDGENTLSREEQHDLTVQAVTNFFNQQLADD
ncbi:carboxymethylenebutenolidase-related protein [Alkalibacterium sp. AK22]|nr:carboxymethylenebutenolidase-related protein [Alkalibacterium sp. AK22]